jgi:hypothetical protein
MQGASTTIHKITVQAIITILGAAEMWAAAVDSTQAVGVLMPGASGVAAIPVAVLAAEVMVVGVAAVEFRL